MQRIVHFFSIPRSHSLGSISMETSICNSHAAASQAAPSRVRKCASAAYWAANSTLGVTLEMSIAHGQAVMRGSQRACVIVDMPFGSYQASPVDAFKACARVMATVEMFIGTKQSV